MDRIDMERWRSDPSFVEHIHAAARRERAAMVARLVRTVGRRWRGTFGQLRLKRETRPLVPTDRNAWRWLLDE